MKGDSYKETQLIKPGDVSFGESHAYLPQTTTPDDLFQYKNIYRDVKSTVIEGAVKTTKIDKVTKIPKVIFKERKVDASKAQKREKKVVTKEVEIENIIEVPEIQEKVVYNEIKVPTYIDVPVVHPRQAVYYQQISKNVPKGVELVITQTFEVPQIKPKYVEVPVPIYVPCYIEVPIPAHYIPTDNTNDKEYFTSGVSNTSKVSRRPPQVFATAHGENKSSHATASSGDANQQQRNVTEKSAEISSKCSTHNMYSAEQKNVERMVVAGNM